MRIFVDTAPFIYLLEAHPAFCEPVRQQLDAWAVAGANLHTSVITLMEVLVHPLRQGNIVLECQYRTGLSELAAGPFIAVDETVAALAALYRARYRVRTADALQLAAAVTHQCEVFYTHDMELPALPDIRIVQVAIR